MVSKHTSMQRNRGRGVVTSRGACSEMAKDQLGTTSPPVVPAGKDIWHWSVPGDPKHFVRALSVPEHQPGETESSGSSGSCSSCSLRLIRYVTEAFAYPPSWMYLKSIECLATARSMMPHVVSLTPLLITTRRLLTYTALQPQTLPLLSQSKALREYNVHEYGTFHAFMSIVSVWNEPAAKKKVRPPHLCRSQADLVERKCLDFQCPFVCNHNPLIARKHPRTRFPRHFSELLCA